ncbi:MAG: portal protein [bacterium]
MIDSKVLVDEFESLKGDRGNWENMWQDIAELMIPRRADFTHKYRASGEQRRDRCFESTAIRALVRAASGLHNTLTSNTVPWFALETEDRELMKDRNIQLWLEEASRRCMAIFNSPQAGFHSSVHEYYLDLLAFGTGVMFVGNERPIGPVFRSYFLGDCFIAEDKIGRVDSIYRSFYDTSRSLFRQFGSALPEEIKKAAEDDPFKKFEILHVVRPRSTSGKAQKAKPFLSAYIDLNSRKLIKEGGFDEFPYIVSRWQKNSMEVYGRGPGIEALPDTRMINEMERVGLIALQKVVDPPLLVPDDGFLSPIRTTPGGLNYYRAGLGPQDRITPLLTNARIDLNEAKMGQVRQAIERAFYLDLLELPGPTAADGDVLRFSATEIAARQRDRLSILGPIVARQEVEMLGPLVLRTLSILIRNGSLPDPPQALVEADFKIAYSNPVAIAQRSGELASIGQLIQFLVPFAQIDPTIMESFQPTRVAEMAAEILKVSPSVFSTEQERNNKKLEQAQQQQMMMEMQQAQAVAQQQQLISQARRDESTATLNEARARSI